MFRIAFHGLAANKMRSFLTMLGIIIGVAAVIVMVALGQGAAEASQAAIRKLGTNRLFVRPENRQQGGVNLGAESGISLTLRDAEVLRKEARLITAVAPEAGGKDCRIKYRNQNTVSEVNGSTPEYFQVRNLTIEQGRIFTNAEVERRARVIVLGADVARDLFGEIAPVGKSVKVMGQTFQVIGVLKRQGAMPFANRDDDVTVPISTAMRRLFGTERDRVRGLSCQAVSMEKMRDAEEEIREIIRRTHKLGPDSPADVRVHNQADVMESANEQSSFLTMLLAGIALVSLVVGGIGIMNIMLVSVTERTREIGIRKALGAKRKHILYQFLIESVTLSLGGGLIGIGLAFGVSYWMGMSPDAGGLGFPMLITIAPIVVSFVFSALVGIFFGLYPAVKASGLNPIQALRHE